ncbi:hypothetical protein [Kineosporia babensis]|uniref:Uncharacterized protein n=1 Tax=Kineosporia babensis TaxID=499548 RepID=A0A9X1STE9_9ACTN|nr:hypothetical protein [Kineosporia babensis]MCD5311799.1 hypothetical protein [Kineosporia babensis]
MIGLVAAAVTVVVVGAIAVIGLGRDDESVAPAASSPRSSSRSSASASSPPVEPSATMPTEDPEAAAEEAAAKKLAQQKKQAKSLVKVIKQSEKARGKVREGVQLVSSCEDTVRGAALLREAVGIRAAVLSQLVDAEAGALPDGKKIVTALKDAQSESLRADQSYVRWADNGYWNCWESATAYQDSDYQAGADASVQAQAAKKRFVKYWKPVVELTGVRTFTVDQV